MQNRDITNMYGNRTSTTWINPIIPPETFHYDPITKLLQLRRFARLAVRYRAGNRSTRKASRNAAELCANRRRKMRIEADAFRQPVIPAAWRYLSHFVALPLLFIF